MNPLALIGAGAALVFLLTSGVKTVGRDVKVAGKDVYKATVVAAESVGKAVVYPFKKLFQVL